MKRKLPKYCCSDTQGDVVRIFVRRKGRKIRIRAPLNSPEFHRQYADALDTLNQGLRLPDPGPKRGTFEWLARQYYKSVAFKSLPRISQATRRGVIDACLAELYRPGSDKTMGEYPAEMLQAAHIRVLRDRKAGKPGAANARLKILSSMFSWAVESDYLPHNPVRDVKKIKYATDGFRMWTLDECLQFQSFYPIGTKARIAFEIMYSLASAQSMQSPLVRATSRMV